MFNFRAMVGVLAKHGVEFAIVGGLAGVMQGAPIHTNATFWDDPRMLRPGISHLESRGHKLLSTRFGRIDCLATIEEQTAFEDVLDDLDWMELDGTPVRVLSLPRLIEVKKKLSRPKDQLALLQLQATLEERRTKSEA